MFVCRAKEVPYGREVSTRSIWATPTCLGENGLREEKGRGFLAKHNETSLSAAFVVVYDIKSAPSAEHPSSSLCFESYWETF